MPRFLSPEWVEAFNAALRDVEPGSGEAPGPAGSAGSLDAAGPAGSLVAATDTSGSLVAAGGRYRIAQVVLDPPADLAPGVGVETPRGVTVEVQTVLVVEDGRASLLLGSASGSGGDEGEPDVTVVLSYGDAAALSRGELDPINMLAAGRVRIRGDLSVLVAGQALLAAAAARLAGLHAVTTY